MSHNLSPPEKQPPTPSGDKTTKETQDLGLGFLLGIVIFVVGWILSWLISSLVPDNKEDMDPLVRDRLVYSPWIILFGELIIVSMIRRRTSLATGVLTSIATMLAIFLAFTLIAEIPNLVRCF